jgi:hypothetical protein
MPRFRTTNGKVQARIGAARPTRTRDEEARDFSSYHQRMVRLGVRSRRAATVLAFVAAACSAHSRVQQRPGTDGGAGRANIGGSSAGRESDGGEGGGGALSAAGRGVTGGTSGASSQSGVGGTAGGAGEAAGGAPEAGGAPAAGGASEAGTGGEGDVGDGPAWIPTGVFGPAVDDFLEATTEYLEAQCREGLCLGPDGDEEILQDCVEAELHNFAPSLEWVACASRTGAEFEHVMTVLAAENRACAAMVEPGSCSLTLCPPSSVDRSFDGCPEWHPYSTACPTGTATFGLCNGRSDCPDGYDERNCERQAPAYICADRMTVDWHAICDGTDDCSDGIDEFRCER